MTVKLTQAEILMNALREIAAHASQKGGDWASEQAFETIEFVEAREPQAAE